MELVFLSDTHYCHKEFDVGQGDVLIHSGDAEINSKDACVSFAQWMDQQKFKYKIFVPGNHDSYLADKTQEAISIFHDYGINVLIDDGIKINDYLFWGTPYVPQFGRWDFMKKESELLAHYKQIPPEVDVLITHGPPKYILDQNHRGDWCGSEFLSQLVMQKKPIVHAFGHIHDSYGYKSFHDILFINSAVAPTFDMGPNEPIRVILEYKKVVDIIS